MRATFVLYGSSADLALRVFITTTFAAWKLDVKIGQWSLIKAEKGGKNSLAEWCPYSQNLTVIFNATDISPSASANKGLVR